MVPGSVNVMYVTLRGFARPSHFFQPLEALSPAARRPEHRSQKPIEAQPYHKSRPKSHPAASLEIPYQGRDHPGRLTAEPGWWFQIARFGVGLGGFQASPRLIAGGRILG